MISTRHCDSDRIFVFGPIQTASTRKRLPFPFTGKAVRYVIDSSGLDKESGRDGDGDVRLLGSILKD